jgi:hypothetical protein
MLEAVFDSVAETQADTTALLTRMAAEGRSPSPGAPTSGPCSTEHGPGTRTGCG